MTERICAVCGNAFISPRAKGKYCSQYCRNRRVKNHGKRKYEKRVCEKCGREYTTRADSLNKFCGYKCYWDAETVIETPMNRAGYLIERTRGDGWKLQHRMIVERYLKRKLRDDEVVHHIDHDKTNNDISNLTIMTRSEHARLHAEERKQLAAADG